MTKKRVTAAFALLVAAALLVSLLPLLPFSMPQAVAEQWTGSYEGSYYDNLNENLDGLQFREQLAQLITDTHSYQTTYNELSSVYAQSDADPYNNGNVIWFYSGTSVPYDGLGGSVGDTNREHVWPKDGGRGFYTISTGFSTSLCKHRFGGKSAGNGRTRPHFPPGQNTRRITP